MLCVFWVWSYAVFSNHFQGSHQYEPLIEELKKEKEMAVLERRVLQEEMFSFRQQMVAMIPGLPAEKFKGKGGYALRQIASTMPSDGNALKERLSLAYLSRGKARFRESNIPEAIRIFSDYITRYPYSPQIGEAYFLLSESYFRARDFENATKTIQKMVSLFPANELTGFALIRMGQIFEFERRPEEAAEVYRTVLRSFPQREVASQAADSIRNLEF